MAEQEQQTFARLVQRIDPRSKLLRAWALKGGVSARITALEIERADGQRTKLVVRQHGEADLRRNPRIAADEFQLLRFLRAGELAVPEPCYLDASGEIFSAPSLVIAYVEGETDFAPVDLSDCLLQLATHLSRLHQLDNVQQDLSFLPRLDTGLAEKLNGPQGEPDETMNEGRIRAVLEAARPFPQRNASTLLHGDFWPGNVLWKNGQLVALIDWEDAALGDPLADLANSRLEILWAFGSEAMQYFTQQYQNLLALDFTLLPCWDLWAALRPIGPFEQWGLDETTERTMRERHRWFVAQALQVLSPEA